MLTLLFSGKSEISSVVYKVGECMQELIKLWKEHEASHGEKNGETSVTGPTLEIQIPSEHVTATNRQVRSQFVCIELTCNAITHAFWLWYLLCCSCPLVSKSFDIFLVCDFCQ